ncbi:Ig-like domain-containing protein [Herbaspirillum seropedicae]|uniref:Ig-like domain-containing protein n=1 Tax=Herbaspirillum seropedicae TaxID=964 RepID=UPI0006527B12|nr:Ig-like domain-containing protein [Herbaspirillum seropedicae]AKN66459.1 hypothetical protein ACP92_15260 [Herbaspirillum seropedicae]
MTTATTNLAQSRQFLQSLTGRKIDEEDLPGAHSLGAHAADAFSVSTSVTGGSVPTAATSMRLVVKGAEPGAKVQIVADSVVDGFKTLFVLGSATPDSQGVIQLNTSRINGYFENLRAQQIVDGKVGQFTDVQSEAGGPFGAIHWDHVAPTVKVSGPFRDPAAASDDALNVKFSFSEAPVGFSEKSVVVTGGTLKNLKASDASGMVYTGDFIPSSPSAAKVTVKVKSGGYTDAAGNAGEGSPLLSVLLEKNNLAVTGGAAPAPGASASADSAKAAVADTVAPTKPVAVPQTATVDVKPLTVTTSEPDGFWPTNALTMSFQVSGGKPGAAVTILAADLLDGVKGSFTLGTGVPDAKGVLTLDTSALNGRFGHFRASQPVAGKPDQVVAVTKPSGASFDGVQWDHVLPWVEIIGPDTDKLVAGKPFTVKFLFGEAPAAFSEKNVAVTGGTLTDVKQAMTGGMLYTGVFKPSSAQAGKVSLQIKDGAFTDQAGNRGQASEVLTISLPQAASTSSADSGQASAQAVNAFHSVSLTPEKFDSLAKQVLAQTTASSEAPAASASSTSSTSATPSKAAAEPAPVKVADSSKKSVAEMVTAVLDPTDVASLKALGAHKPFVLSSEKFDIVAKQVLAQATAPGEAPAASSSSTSSTSSTSATSSKAAAEPAPVKVADSSKKSVVEMVTAVLDPTDVASLKALSAHKPVLLSSEKFDLVAKQVLGQVTDSREARAAAHAQGAAEPAPVNLADSGKKAAAASVNHAPEGEFGIGDYNAKVGSVITADIGNIKDADGIVESSRHVKWYAEDLDRTKTLISSDHFQGGDSSKLIVSADLLYKRITATLEYTDKNGNHESVDASSPALVSWSRGYEVGKLSFAGAEKPVEHAQLIARDPGSSVYILDVNGDGKITSADATSYITSLDSKGGMRINIDGGKGTAKLLGADDALWAKFGLPRMEWGSADGSKGMAAADGKAAVAGGDFWTSTPGQAAGSHLVWSKSGGDHGAAGAYLQADAAPPLDVSRLHYNVFQVSVMPT